MKQHDEKWGESEWNFLDTDNPQLKQLEITYDTVKTEQDAKQQKRDFSTAAKREQYLREQDLDMLFTMLRKHIQTWWD